MERKEIKRIIRRCAQGRLEELGQEEFIRSLCSVNEYGRKKSWVNDNLHRGMAADALLKQIVDEELQEGMCRRYMARLKELLDKGETLRGLVREDCGEVDEAKRKKLERDIDRAAGIVASQWSAIEENCKEKIQGKDVQHNLPLLRVEFIGRKQPLENLLSSLQPHTRAWVITIAGEGGIGKTVLALKACHELVERGEPFKAILWISAKRVTMDPWDGRPIPASPSPISSVDLVYNQIEVALGLRIGHTPDPDRKWCSVWKEIEQRYGATLLVLDNLETFEDKSIYRHIEQLPSPHKVLITSRQRDVTGEARIRLTGMDPEEARSFLKNEGRAREVTVEEDFVEAIRETAEGNPLVMQLLLGLWKRKRSLPTGANALADQREALDFLFRRSVESLNEGEMETLIFTSFLPAGITQGMIRAMGCAPQAPAHLISLFELGLVSRIGSDSRDRYVIVPFLKSFLMTSKDIIKDFEDFASKEVILRLTDFYCGFISENKGLDHLKEIEPEIENVLKLLEDCFHDKQYKSFLKIWNVTEIGVILENLGRWEKRIRYGTIAMEAADMMGDQCTRAWIHSYDVGWIYFYKGDWEQARKIFKETLDMGSSEKRHWELRGLGPTSAKEDKFRKNPWELIALAKRNLGLLAREEGNCDEARSSLEESLRLWQELGDRRWEAITEGSLGVLCLREGFIAEARHHLEWAQKINGDIQNLDGLVSNLRDLSAVSDIAGEELTAQEYIQEAHRKLKEFCVHRKANIHYAHNLIQFARVFKARGRHLLREAYQFVEDAILICEKLKAEHSLQEARKLKEEIERRIQEGGHIFIGREEELKELNKALNLTKRRKRLHLISIDGPPGVGKGKLLKQWATQLEKERILVAMIDGCELRGLDQASILQRIRKQLDRGEPGLLKFEESTNMDPLKSFIESINEYSSKKPLVLTFSNYQELNLSDFWLRDIINSLTGRVMVIMTSPYPFIPWERSIDSNQFIRISLRGFNPDEIRQFLQLHNISGNLAEEIGKQSKGMPLFLSILAEIHVKGSRKTGDSIEQTFLEHTQFQLRRMSESYASPLRKIFEVAAVTRCFNDTLIRKVLGKEAADAMPNLRSFSPYINFHQDKTACLHETFRKALIKELRRSNLDRYNELVRRILPLCADPDIQSKLPCLFPNLLWLISDTFVGKTFFPKDLWVEHPLPLPQVQPVRGGDLVELIKMDQETLSRHWDLLYPKRQEYLEKLFITQGESLRLTKDPKDQRVTGFYIVQRVAKKLIDELLENRFGVRDLLAGEPLLAATHSEGNTSDRAGTRVGLRPPPSPKMEIPIRLNYFIHYPVCLKEDTGKQAQAALLRDMIGSIVSPDIDCLITVNYDEKEGEFLKKLGFKEVEGTSERDKLGINHSVYLLDLKAHGGLIGCLSEAISIL